MLAVSNPLLRPFPIPAEGRDLNLLLQDPGRVIHPPRLYMGGVGFSVAFALAALPGRDRGADRARCQRCAGGSPTPSDAEAPLQRMVESIQAGRIGNCIPFDLRGQPVDFG